MRLPVTCFWSASALGAGRDEPAANLSRRVAPGMVQMTFPHDTVRWFGSVLASLPEIQEPRWNMRSCQLVALALDALEGDLKRLVARYGAGRIGVVLGASNTGIDEAMGYVETWLDTGAKPEAMDFSMIELGTPTRYLQERLGLSGPAYTVSTACSSAAKAFGAARRLIEAGVCDAVITGGVDGRCRFAVNGFAALGALSPGRCRPLAPDRDGINLGEAVALFVMERQGEAPFYLSGVGETSDAYHATAPDPSGVGAEAAMREALADAHLSPADIGYINLHGTGTQANDEMELKAVGRVFQGCSPVLESTKGQTGHCLGAAGAIEAAICLEVLARTQAHHALSNSFAFGGSNASVVFSAA